MNFTPKTEKQIREEQLLPKGEYDATVIKAEDQTSKKGNEMIAIGLRVYKDDGSATIVNDYLMEAMLGKLLRFCEAAGIKDKYDAGTLCANDCLNADVRVSLTIKVDQTGQYPDQNNVKDYKAREASSGPSSRPPRESPVAGDKQFAEADVPFMWAGRDTQPL